MSKEQSATIRDIPRIIHIPTHTASQKCRGSGLTADKLVSRTYDARNRLIQAITAQQTLSFEVNALGQRVRKRGSNLTLSPDTVYHYDNQGRLLAESPAPSGSTIPRPTKEYIWLGDLPLVVYAGTTPYYIHSDHLNTPRLISDAQGQTRWYWLNDEAFGANAPNEQPTAGLAKVEFNLRFAGQYWDKETATSYNYFRDYNPQVGRYTTSDPIGLQGGINTYTYVENDPLRKIDPLGLAPKNPSPAASYNERRNTAEGIPDGVRGIVCAMGLGSCPTDDSELFVCLMKRCNKPNCKASNRECPRNDDCAPYTVDYRAGGQHAEDPNAVCTCVVKGFNPRYKGGPPPGL